MRRLFGLLFGCGVLAALSLGLPHIHPPREVPAQLVQGGGGDITERPITPKQGTIRTNGRWPALATTGFAANGTIPSGSTWREYFMQRHSSRIRQTGPVKEFRWFYQTPGDAQIDTIRIKVWRYVSGTNYQFIGQSDARSHAQLTVNAVNTIPVSTTFTANEGDYQSVYAHQTVTDPAVFAGSLSITANKGKIRNRNGTNANPRPGGLYSWDSGSETLDREIQLEAYMDPPVAIFIGASLTAGANSNYSLWSDEDVANDHSRTALDSTIAKKWSTLTGYNYQIFALGGTGMETAVGYLTGAGALFKVLDTKPSIVCMLDATRNDINVFNYDSTIIDSVIVMRVKQVADSVNNRNATLVWSPITPNYGAWRGPSTMENRRAEYADRIDLRVAQMLTNHAGDNVIVDTRALMGLEVNAAWLEPRDDDPGDFRLIKARENLWELKSLYDIGDNAHMNRNGYQAWAQAIYDALQCPCPSIPE